VTTLSRLSGLQLRVLRLLADLDPAPILFGGAALVGFHLGHRRTRDLDLLWPARPTLGSLSAEAVRQLQDAGLGVSALQESPSFQRLRIEGSGDVCIVDLVSDPAAPLSQPSVVNLEGRPLSIEARSDCLTNKLCTLLGRAEVRDLVDVQALIGAGESLAAAIRDAPLRDGGFSPLTLAWVLQGTDIGALAHAEGMQEREAASLTVFRDQLIETLLALARPDATQE
jgi:hypothetical protein